MTQTYPDRPMMPRALRIACMVFGALNLLGLVLQLILEPFPEALTIGVLGVLVGGACFAFGWYGGLPLFETVSGWTPPADPTVITAGHRAGLRLMRRWWWQQFMVPMAALVLCGLLVMPSLMAWGHPEAAMLVLVPAGIFSLRYVLSRCPRCGFGFFTRSTSRAAFIRRLQACGHCGLPLDAWKEVRT